MAHSALSAPPDILCPDMLPGCGESSSTVQKNTFFKDILPSVLDWVMGIGAAGGVLMGTLAGTMYLFAGANEDLRGRAHKTLLYAILGIFLSAFAFFIVEIINRLPFPNS